MRRVRKFLARCRLDERGASYLVAVILTLPIIFGAVGMAADQTRNAYIRAAIQNQLDMATVAGASMVADGGGRTGADLNLDSGEGGVVDSGGDDESDYVGEGDDESYVEGGEDEEDGTAAAEATGATGAAVDVYSTNRGQIGGLACDSQTRLFGERNLKPLPHCGIPQCELSANRKALTCTVNERSETLWMRLIGIKGQDYTVRSTSSLKLANT